VSHEESAIRYVDTHAHLDEPAFDRDRDTVIAEANAMGVEAIVNIAYRPARWKSSTKLAAGHRGIAVAVGLHPHHADEFTDTTCDDIASWVVRIGACALGEIGLDYFRNLSSQEAQRRAFVAQLRLAADLRLPVIIHQRAAEADLIEILSEWRTPGPLVLHSFDGSRRLAQFAIERGYYFGVGGLMTRPTSDELRAIIARVPAERLLLETDAPYLKPAGARGSRNVPANIPRIASNLAALRGWSLEETSTVTTANAVHLFCLQLTNVPVSPP
jgi:TatD DNase family protein